MLKPCITSASILRDESLEEDFKTIKSTGFECLDFNIDLYLSGSDIRDGNFSGFYSKSIDELKEYFTPHKELAKKYGIIFNQAHAPFQLYVDGRDDINEKCVEVVEKCLAICDYVDCRYLVVHPINLAFSHDREYEKKVNIEYYKRFIPFIKKYKVMVCLENMFSVVSRVVTEAVCSDCITAAWYIDTLNEIAGEECFGFCFDLGHMTLLGKHICESLKTLGSRVKILHLHDNDNIQDNHAIPYSYARMWGQNPVTDWEGLIAGLRAINYRGNLDFEVATGVRLVPEEVRPAQLAYVHAIGEYFAKKILE